MKRTLALLALLTAAGAASAQPGANLSLKIDAAPTASYQMLCHVRTNKNPGGGIANRYGVEKTGPYTDTLPSPIATCQVKKTGGPGPVTVTLYKPGVSRSVTVTTIGPAGQKPLTIF